MSLYYLEFIFTKNIVDLSKQAIVNQYEKSVKSLQVLKQIQQDKNHFQITNLVGSSLSFVISEK